MAALVFVVRRELMVVATKAEIFIHTKILRYAALPSWCPSGRPALSLVVWTLKREVRAFGGCLGMYRR